MLKRYLTYRTIVILDIFGVSTINIFYVMTAGSALADKWKSHEHYSTVEALKEVLMSCDETVMNMNAAR